MFTEKVLSPVVMTVLRIFSVVIYILTVIAAFGGRVNPEFSTFPSLLCLALPYFTIITLLLIAFWFIFKKYIFGGIGVATIFICLSPLSVAFPLGHSRQPRKSDHTFKIISWNVLHTRDIRKPDYMGNRAVEFMINSNADVICLAELKNFSEHEMKNVTGKLRESFEQAYPYKAGLINDADLKILSKYPVKRLDIIYYDETGNSRYDFFEVTFPYGNTLVVAMVHLYSYGLSEEERQVVTEIKSVETAKTSMKEFKGSISDKLRMAFRRRADNAKSLREVIDDISPDIPLIVCGDFNDVPASWTYNIIKGDDMRDAYAETNFGPAITYNLHAFYFHIDQMLYRGPLEALDLTVDKINSSDHYPLVAEFAFTN